MFSSGRVRDPSIFFSQEAIAVTAHAGVAKNNGTPVAVYKGLGMNSVLANSANSYDEWGGTSCHSKPKSSVNGYVFLPCSFHALADVRGVAHPENYIAIPFFLLAYGRKAGRWAAQMKEGLMGNQPFAVELK